MSGISNVAYSVDYNIFNKLSDEVIIQDIGSYFDFNDTFNASLVSRRFRVLFEHDIFWKKFYVALDLGAPPKNLRMMYPFWKSIRKLILNEAEKATANIFSKKYFLSHCISILVMPELSPMHGFALKMVIKQCNLPQNLSANDLILEVAKGTKNYRVCDGARLLAIEALSPRAADPKFKNALISIVTVDKTFCLEVSNRCRAAVQALAPFADEPEVKKALVRCLTNFGPHTVSPAIDKFISDPGIINIVIKAFIGLDGLEDIVKNHLHDSNIVNELVKTVNETKHSSQLGQAISALKPVSDQIDVQRALCRRFSQINEDDPERFYPQAMFSRVMRKATIKNEIKNEFSDIELIREKMEEEKILQMDINKLLKALCDKKDNIRIAAAKRLAPLGNENVKIRNAFLQRIYKQDNTKVCKYAVRALAGEMHRKFYRKALIERGCLDGRLNNHFRRESPELRLITIKVLRPHMDEPEVREAFLKRLKYDESSQIRCELLSYFAPQIEKEDVLPLFLDAAKDMLERQYYHSGDRWQAAAIDSLKAIIDKPEVKMVILDIFKKSFTSVKAACIRALCSESKIHLELKELLYELTKDSPKVQAEARKALANRINYMSSDLKE